MHLHSDVPTTPSVAPVVCYLWGPGLERQSDPGEAS